ncbi:MAG: FecR domain-containing protein [Bauldia sp.]
MLRCLVLAVALVTFAALAEAGDPVGKVARVQGEATSDAAVLSVGSPVEQDQAIETGDGARLEIVFVDGTALTVGEKSKVTIDRFVFDPYGPKNALELAVVGPFRFVSGKLGKALGSNVSIKLPFATMGIRGTDVWGGPIDDKFGVFLAHGIVTVSAAGATVVLSRPGSGTNVERIGAAPGKVTTWPKDKVARANATVTFR